MSLSKSKCWYSNNCLHFLKHAVPLGKEHICREKAPNIDAQGTIHLQRLPIDRAQGDLLWVH